MTLTVIQCPPLASRASLIARHSGQAPRYTSYPTAVQFSEAVGADTYRQWLGALDAAQPVSLYLHIPFCTRLCWYCGCNTRAVNRHEPIASYVDALMAELGLLRAALPAAMRVGAIHFGGGSPNLLSTDELDIIFGGLRGAFRLEPDVEIAAELDPATLTEDWVRAAGDHGLTRASLGVQNLSPQVQEAVNRVESPHDISRAVAWLRAAGVGSINLDLMYGLPHQTVENTIATLDQVLTLRPDRLAVFGYAHVPRFKAHQRLIEEEALPDAAARMDQMEAVRRRLAREDYVAIGMDHFALPEDDLAVAQAEGRLRRNFQGYTSDPSRVVLGLGASAIGETPFGFIQNEPLELAWRAALGRGELPVRRGVATTPDDRFRGEIIERLMCDLQADLPAICERHGVSVHALAPELRQLAVFVDEGLIFLDDARIQLTPGGREFLRPICAVFDRYFEPESGRHSRAV